MRKGVEIARVGARERARYTDIEGEREGVRDSVGECRIKNREKME